MEQVTDVPVEDIEKSGSPYSMFETDAKKENETGHVLDYGSFSVSILRAGGANTKFATVLFEKTKLFKNRLVTDLLDESASQSMLAEVYAESVIIGWDNFRDRDGKVMEYTKQNVVKAMLDLPDLFLNIRSHASSLNTFKLSDDENDSKKS